MDNMRLYYHGNDMAAFASVIDNMVSKLQNVLPVNGHYGKDSETLVSDAIAQLQAAKSGSSMEDCVAALENGKQTMDYAQGSVKAYKHIEDNMQPLYDNINTVDLDIVTPSIYDRAEKALSKAEDSIESGDLNNEEAEALAQEMELLTGLLLVENFDNASEITTASARTSLSSFRITLRA